MKAIRTHFTCFLLAVVTWSCVSPSPQKADEQKRVSIMSYNVENLFDTKKADGKNDHAYLPLAKKNTQEHRAACNALERDYWREECLTMDWSEEVLKEKFRRLSHVIGQVGESGPDILILVEVENQEVMSQLVNEYLPEANYKTVALVDGPDLRGINIGMASRFPVVEGSVRLHEIPFKPVKTKEGEKTIEASRGILEATFRLPDGEPLTVYGVHFPSQGSVTPFREQAIAKLNELYKALPEGQLAVAGGDFNITTTEHPDLYEGQLGQVWKVSHMVGCKGCRGTHYYSRNDSWSFLDALLFSPNLLSEKSGWRMDPASIKTPKANRFQLNSFLSPARFSPEKAIGVSDHLPIYAELVRVDIQNEEAVH